MKIRSIQLIAGLAHDSSTRYGIAKGYCAAYDADTYGGRLKWNQK